MKSYRSVWYRRLLLALAVGVALTLAGCSIFRGAVNASPGLRWWLFANFGAPRICSEMLKRSAPLKLAVTSNSIGRFFPARCQHTLDQNAQTITVQFGGTGYAWTPLGGRVTFSMDAGVEYRPDFRLTDDAVYVWARTNRIVYGPDFRLIAIENKAADWASKTPAGYLANNFGNQLVSGQLASGFTVVRTDAGDQFQLGILNPPDRPNQPFELSGKKRLVLLNETTEVHYDQVDFIGPLEVVKNKQALFVRFATQGPRAEVFLLRRGAVDAWRYQLERGALLGPPPEAPLATFVLEPGRELQQKLQLPPGQYYFVLDNSGRLGSVAPPWSPTAFLGNAPLVASVLVQLGSAK
jgi:hypothetical protein